MEVVCLCQASENISSFRLVLRVDERSLDFHIGRHDFLRKSHKICSRSILIFRGLTCDFFLSSVHFCC